MPRPGITPPMIEMMAPLPVASMAGCVLVPAFNAATREYDYIYGLFPTSATAATFWRYTLLTNTWQQLASPTLDGFDLLTTACAMIHDPTSNRVYLINSRNAAPMTIRP
jgi:hypothetical protein